MKLIKQLAGVANGVKRLKDKNKGLPGMNSDDEDDEDFLICPGSCKDIDNLDDGIEYTEDEYNYMKNLDTSQREEFVKIENKILELSKEEVPIRFKI